MKRTTLYKVNYRYFGMWEPSYKWFDNEQAAEDFRAEVWKHNGGADIERHCYGNEKAAEIMAEQKERDLYA